MLALLAALTLAQCTKDTDCKGTRVCAGGECTETFQPPSPTPAPAPVGPPTLDPNAVALAQAQRIARVAELRAEVRDLTERLDDATLGGPIIKLIGATAFTVLGVALLNAAYAQRCYAGCDLNPGTVGGAVASGVAAVALWIWGGIQLRLRVEDRRRLPEDIESRKAQLRALGARP